METPAAPGRRHLRRAAAQLLLRRAGLAGVAGIGDYAKGIYGTAIATMGMLSCAAYILAMDTFGPITDNAGGIIEMSHQPEEIRETTDRLDAAGNTTKALTKGYAIGSASLAAFLLFSAYLEEITRLSRKGTHAGGFMPAGWTFTNINLAQIPVFVGALLGAMLTYLFSSLAIKAVGRTAQMVVEDVRDQFKENPGIMLGTSKPDYAPLRQHRHRRRAQGDGAARRPGRRPAGRRRSDLPPLQRALRLTAAACGDRVSRSHHRQDAVNLAGARRSPAC